MLLTVFSCLIVNIFLWPACAGIQNITVKLYAVKEDETNILVCNSASKYFLLEGSPAAVIVEHNKYINKGRCHYNDDMFTDRFKQTPNNTKLFESSFDVKITHYVPWKCTFYTNRDVNTIEPVVVHDGANYTQVNCTFQVHVRMLKSLVIQVNGEVLSTNRTELSVTEYDSVGYYDFVHGEFINVNCTKPDVFGALQFKFHNSKGDLIFQTDKQYANFIRFQAKLKAEYDKGYWDCICFTRYSDFTVARIHMRLQKVYNKMSVHVNGATLQPRAKKQTESIYYYQDGEEVNIVCEKKSHVADSVQFKSSKDSVFTSLIGNNLDQSQINVTAKLKEENNNCALDCVLMDNGNEAEKHTIKFEYLISSNNASVTGLALNNILFRYDSQQGKVTTIHYKYTDNDILNVDCSTKSNYIKDTQCQFQVTDTNTTENMPTVVFVRNDLHSNDNNSTIPCLCTNATKASIGEIRIVLSYQSPTTVNNQANENGANVAEAEQKDNDDNTEAGALSNENSFVVVGGAAACLIIIIAIIVCVTYTYRTRKSAMPIVQSDVNYENLPHHNEAAIAPFPKQWDDYAQSMNRVEEVETYSVPFNQNNVEEIYAKPVPKNERNNKKIGSDPMYAELEFTKKTNGNSKGRTGGNMYANNTELNERNVHEVASLYAEIPINSCNSASNAEANYAQVLPKSERNKCSNNKSIYTNVLDNKPYVNNGKQEYVEPTYCEVNFKKSK